MPLSWSKEAVQILLSFLGSVGFAFLFDIRGYRLVLEGIGGALGWGIYLFFAVWDLGFSGACWPERLA